MRVKLVMNTVFGPKLGGTEGNKLHTEKCYGLFKVEKHRR